MSDSRFVLDSRFAGESEAESSKGQKHQDDESLRERDTDVEDAAHSDAITGDEEDEGAEHESQDGLGDGMLSEGFSGPTQKIVKPLTPEALAKFTAAQQKTGVVYISRIPPGMRPTKVRHLMSQYGEVGRVYLQAEDAKRAYLRRKYTSTKKIHFVEGWVEFTDKKVARSVAEMLNAQPIGGKKGTRWRDDIWTMKYLPKFKWRMLTEQIAHEAAVHAARLRVELSQSKREQQEYLKNVELAHVLEKRADRKRKAGQDVAPLTERPQKQRKDGFANAKKSSSQDVSADQGKELSNVLSSIF